MDGKVVGCLRAGPLDLRATAEIDEDGRRTIRFRMMFGEGVIADIGEEGLKLLNIFADETLRGRMADGLYPWERPIGDPKRQDRDIVRAPYGRQENRVVNYLNSLGAGGGDDPVGFLIASYDLLRREAAELREASPSTGAEAAAWREKAEQCIRWHDERATPPSGAEYGMSGDAGRAAMRAAARIHRECADELRKIVTAVVAAPQ
jgi:hypothetical protein